MNNDFLDTAILEDYLDGKLDAKAMHYVERLSLEDPFVAEALEGLKQSPRRKLELSLLQKQLQERIKTQPVKQERWRIGTHRLSIAATAAVLFVSASIVFWMREYNSRRQDAQTGKNVEVTLTPMPAVADSKTKTSSPAVTAELPKAIEKALEDKAALVAKNVAVTKKKAADNEAEDRKVQAASAFDENRAKRMMAASPVATNVQTAAVAVTVVSLTDGLPISGAEIKDEANNTIGMTDRNGFFNVKADSIKTDGGIKIGYNGFQTKTVFAKVNQRVNVVLSPKPQFEQAEVSRYGADDIVIKADKNAGKIVMPVDGWGAFDKYLAKENRLLGRKHGGFVELEFSVLKDGSAGRFKVIKSIDVDYDAEAIRLLAEGPKWQTASTNGKIRYIVKF